MIFFSPSIQCCAPFIPRTGITKYSITPYYTVIMKYTNSQKPITVTDLHTRVKKSN